MAVSLAKLEIEIQSKRQAIEDPIVEVEKLSRHLNSKIAVPVAKNVKYSE